MDDSGAIPDKRSALGTKKRKHRGLSNQRSFILFRLRVCNRVQGQTEAACTTEYYPTAQRHQKQIDRQDSEDNILSSQDTAPKRVAGALHGIRMR